LQKYKQELAARQTLEATTEFDSDEDGVWIATHVEPHEKMRKLLF